MSAPTPPAVLLCGWVDGFRFHFLDLLDAQPAAEQIADLREVVGCRLAGGADVGLVKLLGAVDEALADLEGKVAPEGGA